jgi:N,N'-diacetyllegionaminate synthase
MLQAVKLARGVAFSWLQRGDTRGLFRRCSRDDPTARAAGVDAVKVECIDADRLLAAEYRDTLTYTFKTLGGLEKRENYWSLLKRLSLSQSETVKLFKLAHDEGTAIFGTAFDLDTVKFLVDQGSCAIKLSSGEINHEPLLIEAARSGLPVFYDTGRATFEEVLHAREVLAQNGATTPVVMHNPSGYPAAPADVNLSVIPLFKQVLDCPVGLSCHSRGNAMVHAAVAIGANVIEKPLSRDNTRDDDEHIFSVNLDDLAGFVSEIRDLEDAMLLHSDKILGRTGDPAARAMFRQSLIASRPLAAGSYITDKDLTFARPGFGFAPDEFKRIIGRRLATDVAAGSVITAKHLV